MLVTLYHIHDEAQRSQQPPLAEASVREPSSSSSAAPTPLAAALPRPRVTFADLPAELRDMIWEAALPEEPRVFNALVYASAGLRMQLLERGALRLPLAHVCAESRRAVRRAGYVLAFRDEDRPADPGVWFHPRRDLIERTIWGPGDFWGLKMPD
ncbi:hypothetical protein GGS23DRAFT_603211 [Durotheca rogersii]|uniref:uncharacterized protein n=1 Tax=Durotheca rogersii TaxID=419775 RepID=UPI0022207181|nr:uncharacterized protein GGS23DRAFT_603211 [Durotheca rogersii]KAI5867094.1 hypothetical protein GGS23DRAFT_603211 [Durotheca rogersii]